MRTSAWTAAVAVVVLGTGAARAESPVPAHAVGGIAVGGDDGAPLGKALRNAAEAGLTGAKQVAPDTVGRLLTAVPDLAGCVTAACLTRFAASTGADRVIAVEVDGKGETFQIAVKVADGSGRAVRVRTEECIACAVPDLQEKVTALVNAAVTAGADDPVTVEIATSPAVAELTIDGEVVGGAPWRGTLAAGPHRIVASDGEVLPYEQEVFVEAGSDGRITLTIPGAVPKVRRWGTRRWIAAGVGGAAMITGIVLLARDGDGTCDQASCPERYEATAAGVTFVGLGLAAGAAAGYMFWQDRKGEERPSWASRLLVGPTAGGFTAAIRGRF